jgi:hypothetical protein
MIPNLESKGDEKKENKKKKKPGFKSGLIRGQWQRCIKDRIEVPQIMS